MTVPSWDRDDTPRASLRRVLAVLEAAGCVPKVRGDHADARCPVSSAHEHGDRNPSLTVDWRDGQTLIKCQRDCAQGDVIAALGLSWAALWDEPLPETDRRPARPRPRKRREPAPKKPPAQKTATDETEGESTRTPRCTVATYTYTDAAGEVVGEVRRLEPKTFRWRRVGKAGRWEWGAPDERPLYRLPAVLEAAAAGEEIWLGEGEKDAEALTAAGVCGTANPGGAGPGKWREEHTAALRGARVVIVADRDEAGEKHAQAVAAALAHVAANVRIVQAAEGKDAADHLAAGHALADFVPLPIVAPPESLEEARTRPRRRRLAAVPDGGAVEDRPQHEVNVTRGGPFRWSDGDDDGFDRGLYLERNGVWKKCGDLPYVHARAMFWTGTTMEAQYVLSARPDSRPLCVAPDDVDSGRWADQLGVPRSASIDIVIALATAIRQMAARESVREYEGAPKRSGRTDTGHLLIPPPAVLPSGYGECAEGVSDDEAAQAWRRVVEVASRTPLLALVLGASAAAPFVGPLRVQSHWWVLYGDPERGKTTALSAGGAIWGNPQLAEGVVMSWNATGKGLGRALGLLGILPAFLDEAGTAELGRDQWAQLVYQTCQGNSRTLSPSRGGAGVLRTASWFGSLFVSSNGQLAQDLAVGKFAGLARRVIELQTPFTQSQADAEAVTTNAELGCGWLGERLVHTIRPEDLLQLSTAAAPLLDSSEGAETETQARIMIHAVAGAMAVDQVLGTGTALTDAAVEAAQTYLTEHAVPREEDGARMLAAFASELAAHRPAWPTRAAYEELGQAFADGRESTRAMHGYEHKSAGVADEDTDTLWVFRDTWRAMVDALGVDAATACRWLHEHEVLVVPPQRRRTGNWQCRGPRWMGQPPVYRLRLSGVLGAGPDDDDEAGPGDPPTGNDPTPRQATLDEPAPEAEPLATAAQPEPVEEEPTVQRLDAPAPCVRCGQPARHLVDGRPRHLGSWCGRQESGARSAPEPPAPKPRPQAPEPANTPGNDAQSTAQGRSRPKTRRAARANALETARAVLAAGGEVEEMAPKLRVLAVLEGGRNERGGPFCPRRRAPGGGYQYPYWRAPLPPIVDQAYVVGGWAWPCPYDGETVPLDRSGAWGAAAASVEVVHGAFKHTGEVEFAGQPGYYLALAHPWHETGMPSPLGNVEPGSMVWLPHPTVALLADLDRQDRWPGLAIADSWTGEPCRLRDWATGYVGELRRHAIETYGRDSDQYLAVKRGFGQATSLFRGSLSEDENGNDRRTWACKAARPDWRHGIESQAAVTLWRKADAVRNALPAELAHIGLKNTDELVLPAEALNHAEIREPGRNGDRPLIELDDHGITYGSFKVKGERDGEG